MTGLGLERAILGSAVRLTVGCARESVPSKMWFISEATSEAEDALSECEPLHDKSNKMAFAPNEDSNQPGHPPSLIRVFSCAQWVAEDPMFLHADSEDSDQSGRMPRLIFVFCGRNGHFVGFVTRRLIYTLPLSRLASGASLTADQRVAGSTPARPHIVH